MLKFVPWGFNEPHSHFPPGPKNIPIRWGRILRSVEIWQTEKRVTQSHQLAQAHASPVLGRNGTMTSMTSGNAQVFISVRMLPIPSKVPLYIPKVDELHVSFPKELLSRMSQTSCVVRSCCGFHPCAHRAKDQWDSCIRERKPTPNPQASSERTLGLWSWRPERPLSLILVEAGKVSELSMIFN
jgi:hypothetical protein